MKYPTHIILDTANARYRMSVGSWITYFSKRTSVEKEYIHNLNLFSKVLTKSEMTAAALGRAQHKTAEVVSSGDKSVFLTNLKKTLKAPSKTSSPCFSSSLWSDFDINFLRKEKMYTKLKYSRCPQYDIVSGGIAALLSGFIGFLICEKFGLELLDSGDFYFAFMYAVIICFSVRPLLLILSKKNTTWSFISPKYLISFYKNLLVMMLRSLKSFVLFDNGRLPNTLKYWFIVAKNTEYVSTVYDKYLDIRCFFFHYPRNNWRSYKYKDCKRPKFLDHFWM